MPSIDSPGVDHHKKHVSFASAMPNKTTSANAPSPSKVLSLPEGERRATAKKERGTEVVTLPGLRGLPKSSSAGLCQSFVETPSSPRRRRNRRRHRRRNKLAQSWLSLRSVTSPAKKEREEDCEENANDDEGKEHDQRIRSMSKQAHTRISSIWRIQKEATMAAFASMKATIRVFHSCDDEVSQRLHLYVSQVGDGRARKNV